MADSGWAMTWNETGESEENTTWSYNEKLASYVVGVSTEHKHKHATSWCDVVSSIDPKFKIWGAGGHYTDIGHYPGGQRNGQRKGQRTGERRCFWAGYGQVQEGTLNGEGEL